MAAWNYPGKQRRGQKNLQCTEPRWGRTEWKSLAWATQLLAALDCFFVVLTRSPLIGDAVWYCVLVVTAVLFVLVSVLAVRE